MVTRMQFTGRREQRREFAAELVADRDKRGDAGQLARLETGGHGHCKEAEKLRQKLGKAVPEGEE